MGYRIPKWFVLGGTSKVILCQHSTFPQTLSSLTLGQPAILGNLWQSLTTLTELLPGIPCNIPSGSGTPFLLILTLHPSYPIYSQPRDSNYSSAAIPVWDSVSVSPQKRFPWMPAWICHTMLICCHQHPPSRQTEPLVWNNREWCWLAPRTDRLPPRELHWQRPDGKRREQNPAQSSAVMQLLGWTPRGAWKGCAGGSSSNP